MARVKNVFYGLVLLGIGLFLLIGPPSQDDGQVLCGSQVMSPGDVCDTTVNGDTTERSYEEQRGNNRRVKTIAMVLGGVLGLGGAVLFVSGVLPRRRAGRESGDAVQPTTPGGQ